MKQSQRVKNLNWNKNKNKKKQGIISTWWKLLKLFFRSMHMS